jgi:hypothetical protein
MQEERKYERFALRFTGRIILGDSVDAQVLDVVTNDVSAGGAFFHTAKPLAIGARAKLMLIVASRKLRELTDAQGLLKAEGTVVRSSAEGIAICFGGEPELVPIAVPRIGSGDRHDYYEKQGALK